MDDKKILIIGGPDVNSRIDLIDRLKSNYRFACLGSSNLIKEDFSRSNIEYYSYPLNLNFNLFSDIISLLKLIRLIKVKSPHIVHTFDTKPGLIGRIAAKICSVPIIISTLPGLGILFTSSEIKMRILRLIYEKITKIVCRLSEITVFQNPDDKELFINKGIVNDSNSTIILGSGIDINQFSIQNLKNSEIEKLRTEIGVNKDEVVVTLISRLLKSKGIREFASAAKLIGSNKKKIKFLLVGDYNPDEINSFSKDEFLNISDQVIWLGFRSDVKNIISISNIIVLPTYYREGIPRVLLEGASLNKPLIATNTPGCREIIVNGKNGYLIEPRNVNDLKTAILKLVNDPEKMKEMGDCSRNIVSSNFNITVVAKKYKELYGRVIKKHYE